MQNTRSTLPELYVYESSVSPGSVARGDVWLQGNFDVHAFDSDRYKCFPGWEHPFRNFSLWPCERCGIIRNGSASAETLAGRLAYANVSTLGEACR